MVKIITLANQKGGVGKTTCTFNLGGALSKLNKKVLLIDLDSQESLSIILGLDAGNTKNNAFKLLNMKDNINAKDCIVNIKNNLDVIPASSDLTLFESLAIKLDNSSGILKNKIKDIQDDYDFILIDCPPNLGLLTINALSCSSDVIIPAQTHYLSFIGINQIQQTINFVKNNFNTDLNLMGILVNMYQSNSSHDKEFLEIFQTEFNVIGIIKNSVSAKHGLIDGLSVLENSSKNELSKEFIRIAEAIEKGKI